MSNDCEEPVGSTLEQGNEAVRVVPSPAEVDNNSNSQGKDISQNESARVGSSLDVEMQPKDATTNTPVGLGLRGLQPLPARVSTHILCVLGQHNEVLIVNFYVQTPKRPARQQQSSNVASTLEQAVQNQNTSASHEQGGTTSLAGGQHNAQGSPSISDTRSVPSQMSPVFQLLNNMPSRRGGGGNFDIGSLISQFATNAGGTTRSRDQDQGLGLPAGALSNLMGQVMQNPFMRNVVQQVVEQVGDEALDHDDLSAQGATAQGASPQGGLDFSRLLQEMMPVVSQAINRVSNTTGSEQASSLLQGINARTGGENGVARGGTEAVREGLMGFEDMLSNGLSASNGSNLSAIFQQMMPVVAQAFGGALTSRQEQASGIPSNLNSGSVENGDGGTAARQVYCVSCLIKVLQVSILKANWPSLGWSKFLIHEICTGLCALNLIFTAECVLEQTQEDISQRDESSQLGSGEPESPVAKRQKVRP